MPPKTMIIFAFIPTYNEAENIENIVAVVDHGMQLLLDAHPGATLRIIAADSCSTDNTVALFKTTPTKTPKTCIQNPTRGKGVNLLSCIDFAQQEQADYCFTVDADVTSAQPEWVLKLLEPLIRQEADFVTPLYQRTRLDGCITLHFAYPTIRAFTGQRILQPIGGEFAFNRRFIQLAHAAKKPSSAYTYGIDIFMTFLAASHGLTIAQIPLGAKIHSPVNKMKEMLPQVAAAAAFMAQQAPPPQDSTTGSTPALGILREPPGSIMPGPNDAYNLAKQKLRRVPIWTPPSGKKIAQHILTSDDTTFMTTDPWVEILTAWYDQVLRTPAPDLPHLAQELLPFFILRTLGFWDETSHLPTPDIETIVETQASKFQNSFIKNIASN